VDYGETVEAAVQRELEEETGIRTGTGRLVGVYSAPDRDPRRHNVSVAFLMQPSPQQPVGGDDAASAAYVDDWRDVELAFDHRRIVDDACRILQGQ
jgi:8-oxo-dGTP diphosphatase